MLYKASLPPLQICLAGLQGLPKFHGRKVLEVGLELLQN